MSTDFPFASNTERDRFLRRIAQGDETVLFGSELSMAAKSFVFKRWLHGWQAANLPGLRAMAFHPSEYVGKVTLVMYAFGAADRSFDPFEFSILHTWRMIGRLPVSIVTNGETEGIRRFRENHPEEVSVRLSQGLVEGDTESMSLDCMSHLYEYFETPYCLIIQDDGFPIQNTLNRFLGKWDYIGAPNVRDGFRQHIADLILRDALNGGFCLRSRRFCKSVAVNWKIWGRAYARLRGLRSEDNLYVCMTRLNPWVRLRYRIPGAREARRFSFYDLSGAFDARTLKELPFGMHGQSTIWQLRHVMRGFGYNLDFVPNDDHGKRVACPS